MSAVRRMALAFCCTLLGVALFAVLFTIPGLFRILFFASPGTIRYNWRWFQSLLQVLPFYLLFALPGWVLALPFVLYFRDANGRRAWIMLTIGTCIGPAFILFGTLASSHGRFSWQSDGFGIVAASLIALLTTGSYVVLLRHLTPKRLATSPATESR